MARLLRAVCSPCMACCHHVIRLSYRSSDTDEDRQLKATAIPVYIATFLMGSAIAASRSFISMLGMALIVLSTGTCLIVQLTTGRDPRQLMAAATFFCSLGILVRDIVNAAGLHPRLHGYLMCILDACLVFKVPTFQQQVLIVMIIVFNAVERTEAAVRYGLFEVVASPDDEPMLQLCDCADPPCRLGLDGAWTSLAGVIFVLLTDYFLTRGFAEGQRKQLALVDAAVRVSERVAELLAKYATDDARRVVAEEGDALPESLRASYSQLLGNLDSYRVFLPDSLLYEGREQEEHLDECSLVCADRAPPGLGDDCPNVAVCFTDIQSSTAIWEAHPQGMYDALNIHNKVMREVYQASHGYEVKTIGDSFMVAFDSAADALRFGLEAQLGLLRQQWPEDLLTHPLGGKMSGPDGHLIWGGLRVRIGVEAGPVRVQNNPVTGRSDYFGPTVNTAARLESVLRKGGLVATSDSVVRSIGPTGLAELGSPAQHDAGTKELKGVKERIRVWALAPQALAARMSILTVETDTLDFSAEASRSSVNMEASLRSRTSGGGSEDSSKSAMSGTPRVRAPHASQLQSSNGTCVVARLPLSVVSPSVWETVTSFAAGAALAADKTQGVVESVLSACVFITWNASRRCSDHVAACRRFMHTPARVPQHLGVVSGGMLHGKVAAGRRSFATAVGGCIEFAAALAEEAERCGDAALLAGAVGESMGAAAFRAQVWRAPGVPDVVVWEADLSVEVDDWLLETADEQWGDCIAGYLFRACADDMGSGEQSDLLSELVEKESSLSGRQKQACSRLIQRIASGGVQLHRMPRRWEPDLAPRARRGSRYSVGSGLRSISVIGAPVQPGGRSP